MIRIKNIVSAIDESFPDEQYFHPTLRSLNFLFFRSSDVFKICGSLQFLSGLSLLIGLLSFPAGWDNDEVRGVCGSQVNREKWL